MADYFSGKDIHLERSRGNCNMRDTRWTRSWVVVGIVRMICYGFKKENISKFNFYGNCMTIDKYDPSCHILYMN